MDRDKLYSHLTALEREKIISDKYSLIIKEFFHSYEKALKESSFPLEKIYPLLDLFLDKFTEQIRHPFHFGLYHKKVLSPFDYYKFSLDFLRPLVIKEKSLILHLDRVESMEKQLKKKENVIFFANHQSESDPQAISLLLEDFYPEFAKNIIYVAGERVITDPLAVPFSMGCDLLCIYSKRYINTPPEKKESKQLHNRRAMEKMSRLLSEGGKTIFVAPGGGRDRPNMEGETVVATFDPNSIEMLYLMAKKAKHPTHFYPLSLFTYPLLPPPDTIQKEMGERRTTSLTAIGIAFGDKIEKELENQNQNMDRKQSRLKRAAFIEELVKKNYQQLESLRGINAKPS